ncbi:hypothetical protein CE91St42_33950 [Oscillospiraceae bacterium]|nr:hypothetical protein CE91St42_33950 [Oscillospiraceae bacterium]
MRTEQNAGEQHAQQGGSRSWEDSLPSAIPPRKISARPCNILELPSRRI